MIVVVVPTLDTPGPLARVLAELPPTLHVVVVDDGSRPALGETTRARTTWVRHPVNRGYGAAQKSGFAAALAAGATRVVLLHGDGQYQTDSTLALAAALDDADVALGSRFLHDAGAIPAWRRWGNRLLTGAANLRLGTRFSELHTGARAYRAEWLRELPLRDYSDDFVFDQQILVDSIRRKGRIVERPAPTRYDATTRSISPGRSVAYGLACLRLLVG